jgi:hypothetical protein
MPSGPVEIVDGLVKGIILFAYDFIRLTLAGFLFPVVCKTRRLWPIVFSINKRLSSLSYLVFWVLLAVSMGTETSVQLISNLTGVEKKSDVHILTPVVSAVLISIAIDVLVRVGFSPISKGIRREMYKSLARIAVANMALGACVIMAFAPHNQILGPLFALIRPSQIRFLPFINPILYAFSISLGVVTLKAFDVSGWIRRTLFGTLIMAAAPTVFVLLYFGLFSATYQVVQLMYPPEQFLLFARSTQCSMTSGNIHASALLKLTGASVLSIKAKDLGIYDSNSGAYVGRPEDDQKWIIISGSTYTPIDLVAKYDPIGDIGDAPSGRFTCDLKLIDVPEADPDWDFSRVLRTEAPSRK